MKGQVSGVRTLTGSRPIHSHEDQEDREAVMESFATADMPVLVATDIVARGIDVPGIDHVPLSLPLYPREPGVPSLAGHPVRAPAPALDRVPGHVHGPVRAADRAHGPVAPTSPHPPCPPQPPPLVARVGNPGRATTFVGPRDIALVPRLIKVVAEAEQEVPPWMSEMVAGVAIAAAHHHQVLPPPNPPMHLLSG